MRKIFFLIVICTIILSGCQDNRLPSNDVNNSSLEKRFIVTGEEYSGGFKILIDKETGVKYIFYEYGIFDQRTTAMTPLLDKDGNVVVEKNK